jgi:hypothetical protein
MSPSVAALFLGWALAGHDFPPFQQDEDQRCVRLRGPEEVGEVVLRMRRFSLTPAERIEVVRLLGLLSASEYRTRQRAQAALQTARPGAATLLRRALADDDLEKRRRIQMCLEHLPPRWSSAQAEAAVRLLRGYRPEGVGALLWNYLACAEDEHVEREIQSALRDLRGQGLFALDDTDSACSAQRRCLAFLASDDAEDVSPTSQALAEARTFFRLLAQGDIATLERRCALPFCLGGDLCVRSRDDLKNLLEQIAANYRGYSKNFSLSLEHVRRGDVYRAFAPEGEQRFLAEFPSGEVRAVQVRMRFGVRDEESGAVLIQLSPSGARLIGLGHGGAAKRKPFE